jgi:hypothetical protein
LGIDWDLDAIFSLAHCPSSPSRLFVDLICKLLLEQPMELEKMRLRAAD